MTTATENGTATERPSVIFTDSMEKVRLAKRALEGLANDRTGKTSDRMRSLARRAYGELNNVIAEFVADQLG